MLLYVSSHIYSNNLAHLARFLEFEPDSPRLLALVVEPGYPDVADFLRVGDVCPAARDLVDAFDLDDADILNRLRQAGEQVSSPFVDVLQDVIPCGEIDFHRQRAVDDLVELPCDYLDEIGGRGDGIEVDA